MNVVKILLYLATGILVLGLLFVFALPIVIIGIIFLLLEAVFGVKLIDRRFVGRFHRCSRPRPAQPPAQAADPADPAREAVNEEEAVALPDAPPPERARARSSFRGLRHPMA